MGSYPRWRFVDEGAADKNQVMRAVAYDESLSTTERYLLTMMVEAADPDGSNSFPSQETLGRRVGITARQVRRLSEKLEARTTGVRLVRKKRSARIKGRVSYIYQVWIPRAVDWDPEESDDQPDADVRLGGEATGHPCPVDPQDQPDADVRLDTEATGHLEQGNRTSATDQPDTHVRRPNQYQTKDQSSLRSGSRAEAQAPAGAQARTGALAREAPPPPEVDPQVWWFREHIRATPQVASRLVGEDLTLRAERWLRGYPLEPWAIDAAIDAFDVAVDSCGPSDDVLREVAKKLSWRRRDVADGSWRRKHRELEQRAEAEDPDAQRKARLKREAEERKAQAEMEAQAMDPKLLAKKMREMAAGIGNGGEPAKAMPRRHRRGAASGESR